MESFFAVENWPSLSPLLDEALELPAAEREAWLASLPAEYTPLKSDLRRLLAPAGHISSIGFLKALPGRDDLAGEENDVSGFAANDCIGSWRLIRKLGAGGMASVWLAERRDGLLGRPAAVKLPHGGWRREALAERIAREREILATLDHPNIAKLLDAGIGPNGQPYLTLEYVHGKRIDDYCRERQLPVKARLELCLQVARALAHAHTMLVVHRDLKPSNILVTEEGEVRLLDFGIAKLLDGDATRETELTRLNGRALTLDYASPEQIAGGPVTVASDVYSLGVVLYELLTGARPYKPRRDSSAALEEAILDTEPRPPSEMVAERTIRTALRGDLDTIVLKALKKVPARRYPTVDAFAEDIERHIQNRPVLARPDRPWYRFSKFVRRNRIGVAAAGAVIITLLAGSAVVAWQAQVAFAQRRRAEQVKTFLLSVLMDAHSYRGIGKPLSALDLLKQTLVRIDQMQGAGPETRAELLNILGACLLSQQDTAGAEAAVSRSVLESAALSSGHPQALRARMLRNWIHVFRGEILTARREIEELLFDMRHGGRPLPEDLAGTLRARSDVAFQEGQAPEAESYALEALRLAESRLGPHHNQGVLALISLTYAYQLGKKLVLAVETGDRALRRALDAYSGRSVHANVVKARVAFGQALAASGQADRALAEMTRAIQDDSALFGASSRAVGLDLRNLAQVQLRAGRPEAALRSIDQALSILGEHFHLDSPGYLATLQLRSTIVLAARHATAAP